jgi:DNA-binding MurR/RpiR family transcriptional regulator
MQMQDARGSVGASTAQGEVVGDIFSQRRATSRLSPTEAKVAAYTDENRTEVLISSAAELARCTGTSDATVVRTAQAPGFESLADMRRTLAATVARQSNPAANMRRTLAETGQSVSRAVSGILDTHLEALETLA